LEKTKNTKDKHGTDRIVSKVKTK